MGKNWALVFKMVLEAFLQFILRVGLVMKFHTAVLAQLTNILSEYQNTTKFADLGRGHYEQLWLVFHLPNGGPYQKAMITKATTIFGFETKLIKLYV